MSMFRTIWAVLVVLCFVTEILSVLASAQGPKSNVIFIMAMTSVDAAKLGRTLNVLPEQSL